MNIRRVLLHLFYSQKMKAWLKSIDVTYFIENLINMIKKQERLYLKK